MNEERVVLLTGSSSGLGATMTKHFASKGFGVVMNYVVESDAEKAYEELLQVTDESKVMKYKADVTNREQVKAMFDEAVKKFGKVDILINFAGINRDAPFIELTDEQWDSVVSIHLKGHFICSQQYALHNPDREGVIINLGAACGQIGRKNGANFCSAKAGIIALTKCMALELAPRIRVNCLVPGSIKTREVIDRYDLETEEGLAKELVSLPMNRLGEFEDVTHIIDCMIDAKFTTGANFYVNGGQYMH